MTITEVLLARIADDESDVARMERHGDHNWWSAERVLAECEAKRQIVALHHGPHECPYAPDPENDIASWFGVGDDPCPTLRALAAVYADHADYDEAGRP